MEPGDAEIIACPVDFLGVNYYYRTIIAHKPDKSFEDVERILPKDAEYTEMGWEVMDSAEGTHVRPRS